ncbi:uncharacterized protein [Miscanthus floridulus]|uniref:uncharacterized protein n=1 Tax=Miscanthus floridulus TaxID=154761 RepID=UPI003459FE40
MAPSPDANGCLGFGLSAAAHPYAATHGRSGVDGHLHGAPRGGGAPGAAVRGTADTGAAAHGGGTTSSSLLVGRRSPPPMPHGRGREAPAEGFAGSMAVSNNRPHRRPLPCFLAMD